MDQLDAFAETPEPEAAQKPTRARAAARRPTVTLALCGANLLMALAQVAASGFRPSIKNFGDTFSDWALGVKIPSLVAHGEYWRLVTANFLHGGVWHLFFNLMGLLALGRVIEMFYGPARMLAIFILSAVAGAVASYFFTPQISLGASTGVMGLMGALLAHNFRYRRYLPERLNRLIPMLLLLIALQVFFDLRQGHTDLSGHLGGLFGGIVMAVLLEGRIAGSLQGERDWLPLPTALATTFALLAYGCFGLGYSLVQDQSLLLAARSKDPQVQAVQLERAIALRPHFAEARLALGDLLTGMGREREAIDHYQAAREQQTTSKEARLRLEVLAEGYRRRGERAERTQNWETAARCYRLAIQLTTDRGMQAHYRNYYAYLLADKLERNLDEAEREIQLALQVRPDDAASLDTLAWIYYKQGRYREALELQTRVIGLADQQRQGAVGDELFYHLGAMHEKLGDRVEAIMAYEKSLRSNPTYAPAAEALKRLALPPGSRPPAPPRSGPGGAPPTPQPPDPALQRGII